MALIDPHWWKQQRSSQWDFDDLKDRRHRENTGVFVALIVAVLVGLVVWICR